MKKTSILAIISGVFLTLGVAYAGDCKIVANSSVDAGNISKDDLKAVFLLTKTSIGGHVEPVLEKGGAAHEAFLKTYVGKNPSALETYYRSLVFTGKASMPKTVSDDAEVVAYVAKTKGAIGYVSASAETGGLKTIEVK
jgi:ABC-type phosphate transport system substrate-binding protein